MQRSSYLLIVLTLLLSGLACKREGERPKRATAGVLDLTTVDFIDGKVIRLDGEWEAIPGRLVAPDATIPDGEDPWKNAGLMVLPGPWNGETVGTHKFQGNDQATYRLRIRTAHTDDQPKLAIKITDIDSAYSIYLDRTLLVKVGQTGDSPESERPQFRPGVVHFRPSSDEFTLTLLVSNHHQNVGGVIESLQIGNSASLDLIRERTVAFEMVLFGALFIMGLYHLGLYSLRKKDRSSLTFGLFSIVISIRSLVLGERFITYLIPSLGWESLNTIDYLTFHTSVPLFIWFMYELYPLESSKTFTWTVTVLSSLFAAITIATPKSIYSYTLIPYQIITLVVCLYVIGFVMIRAILHRREGSAIALGGLVFLFVTVVNDILYNNQLISTGNIVPAGLLVFIFSQSFLLSQRFSRAFSSVENLTESLMRTNTSYSRFVPIEFLGLLSKDSIIDLKLGDQIERRMTVLFCDIRSFTAISESMSPGENFDFINSYLRRMSPVIKAHSGFIDKYIGDAIMALFHRNPSDAISAAVNMQRILAEYNRERKANDLPEIRVGIGIHTGHLILGTVGSEERMEGTVISDAVNLANRLEGLTKKFGVSIIASEDSLRDSAVEADTSLPATNRLRPETNRYSIRHLGLVRVKGKNHSVSIYEVFDSDPPHIIEKKLTTRKDFETGINAYINHQYDLAYTLMHQVLSVFPEDSAAILYKDQLAEIRAEAQKSI